MTDDKPMQVKQVPDMQAIKEVVQALLQNFAKEEVGNKVTSNNMTGLTVNLMAALDGQITMKAPEASKE